MARPVTMMACCGAIRKRQVEVYQLGNLLASYNATLQAAIGERMNLRSSL